MWPCGKLGYSHQSARLKQKSVDNRHVFSAKERFWITSKELRDITSAPVVTLRQLSPIIE
jgi:hypothetical protein